ncbi:hypothetical protein NJ8700_09685 [Aggregatibacter aphrophilus NJ8700]|nr:hypothetical protein NJ8700_09685 [Aggregatibacter aphrophilus NJ8700]OBY54962.1 hypothetical protein BBB51_03255 [Aggregatibacter aphrophilus]PNL92491.1 hypothetical protein A6J76_000185 [Aggregatibacter aphrophilus]RDE84503.1 hypothetical protein DPW00_09605 [Aggregatibacter aphrophilus]RDE90266.1 hypothetical protein DPW01_08870 [Aggregatibacter aphrophilus]
MKTKAITLQSAVNFVDVFYINKTVKIFTALLIIILPFIISKFQPNKKAYHSIRLFNSALSII